MWFGEKMQNSKFITAVCGTRRVRMKNLFWGKNWDVVEILHSKPLLNVYSIDTMSRHCIIVILSMWWPRQSDIRTRVVNVAVLVLLLIVSAIRFEYRLKYLQYFSYAVSIMVSVILFHLFLAIFDTILLSPGALVNCVNNTTVPERVQEGPRPRTKQRVGHCMKADAIHTASFTRSHACSHSR